MNRLAGIILAGAIAPALAAWGAEVNPANDAMLPKENPALVWIVGAGIFILTLIMGFKHPGRTHLD